MTSLRPGTWVVLAVLVTSPAAWGLDKTLDSGASGQDVVAAVGRRIRQSCIFSEDRLFLNRMALDNISSENGGLWQITQSQLHTTQDNCRGALLFDACQIIRKELNIDWVEHVTWADLNKPLYSGVAAALYALLYLNGSRMSGNAQVQGQFYRTVFQGRSADFNSLEAVAHDTVCAGQLDLVFILDSSSSVSEGDFELMKSFVVDIVEGLQADVRVALIVYGASVNVVFRLIQNRTGSDVRGAIRSSTKLGGDTGTREAINQASVQLYDDPEGARSGVKKVAVLVTGGYSKDPVRTAESASNLRARGTTIIAIGFGGYNQSELHTIASERTCSHVLTLSNAAGLEDLFQQVKSSICQASLVLAPGSKVKVDIPNPPTPVVIQTASPGPGCHMVFNVTCGTWDIYLAYAEPHPSSIVYDLLTSASHGSPAVLTMPPSSGQGSPVYVAIEAQRLPNPQAPENGCTLAQLGIYVEPSVRLANGSRPSEGRLEVLHEGRWLSVCDNSFDVMDASVVCSMLNYTGATAVVRKGAFYGEAQGERLVSSLQCQKNETLTFSCQYQPLGRHDCSPSSVVGVDCQPGGNPGNSDASTSSDSDNTGLIAGLTVGLLALAGAATAAGLLAKRPCRKNQVDSDREGLDTESTTASDDDVPGAFWQRDAPSMRLPSDHRLPSLQTPSHPALRC